MKQRLLKTMFLAMVSIGWVCPESPGQATEQQAPVAAVAPSDAGMPLHPGVGGVTKPVIKHSVNPKYTREARRDKITGMCVLSLTVGVDGQPHNITVLRSIAQSQPPDLQPIAAGLDANAVKAIEQYRFQPSTLAGKPVAVAINIEVSFRTF